MPNEILTVYTYKPLGKRNTRQLLAGEKSELVLMVTQAMFQELKTILRRLHIEGTRLPFSIHLHFSLMIFLHKSVNASQSNTVSPFGELSRRLHTGPAQHDKPLFCLVPVPFGVHLPILNRIIQVLEISHLRPQSLERPHQTQHRLIRCTAP